MTNLPDPFLASLLRRTTTMSTQLPRLHHWLTTRNPQTLAELLVPPTNEGELIAAVVWFVLMVFAPPS